MLRVAAAWGIGIATIAIAGCTLDRSAITEIDAGARDATVRPPDGGRDAGPRDAGPQCTAGGCDDGSPCTADRCVPAIGCVHDPIDGACDDGVLCNGGDRCGGGTCSVHDGVDPCPGASRCDAAVDRCVGCEDDLDCPPPITGDFGACEFAAGDPCATAGSRSRTITAYACVAEICEPSTSSEGEACVRETDGVACGDPSVGPWSDCAYGLPCSTEGLRTRSVISYVCAGGICETVGSGEDDPSDCARATDGMACGPVDRVEGACSFPSVCAETGTMPVTTSSQVCGAGACGPVVVVGSEPCSRSTDGTTCGSETCEPWSACAPSATGCSSSGSQSRTCRTPSCSGGACGAGASRTESRSCAIDPTGRACTVTRTCGPCRTSGSACPPRMMGTQSCTGPDGTCDSSGTCAAIPMTVPCDC